ncbi:hypothetical protein BJ508DRAFT_414635 [Ascobolus immersus RN42]|uniref:YDG domain-containing protein n=1 Tax=Ascobolus immersus RN42 TaxID=1160509 RepID=A0A3N4I6M4_ASCIM|nr:hypothetical protein BJ508DRAFT_414635 [Ascobolus immersus RN42]
MPKNYDNFDGDSDVEYTRFDDPLTSAAGPLKKYRLLFPNPHEKCCPNGVSTHGFVVNVGLLTPFSTPPTETPITTGRVKEVITDSPGRNKKRNDKGKKRVLYVSSESEEEAPRQHKKKPRQYPELDDEDLHIIDHAQRQRRPTSRRNWQDDGESITSKETPPHGAADEDGDLEGFVVPDEVVESGDDEEMLPVAVRRQPTKERRAKALREFEARKKEAEERKARTPRARVEARPLPKTARVEKNLGRGLGRETRGTVSVPVKKAVKEIVAPKTAKGTSTKIKNTAPAPLAPAVAPAPLAALVEDETLVSKLRSEGAMFLTAEERNDPTLAELRASHTDPSRPLPTPIFADESLLDGRMRRARIRFDTVFLHMQKLIDTNNWHMVANNIDRIGHSLELPIEYLTPTIRLTIKKLAYDKPPYACTGSEARARNIAALIWYRWQRGIYSPDPARRRAASKDEKGTRSQLNSDLGYIPGEIFPDRNALIQADMHRSYQAGIAGYKDEGAHSIVFSKSEYNDRDHGDDLWYSGTDSKDGVTSTLHTRLMEMAFKRGNKIRVFRTKECGAYAPKWGIRFDGMYRVVEKKDVGGGNWRFHLKREGGQWPILYPTPLEMAKLGRLAKY